MHAVGELPDWVELHYIIDPLMHVVGFLHVRVVTVFLLRVKFLISDITC